MEHVSNWIKGICAVIGGVLSWLFGDLSGMFYALVAFVVIDYITGVIAAAVQQELNSTIGFKGIAKKVFIFLIV